jgi:hypothetical protein
LFNPKRRRRNKTRSGRGRRGEGMQLARVKRRTKRNLQTEKKDKACAIRSRENEKRTSKRGKKWSSRYSVER